MDRGVNRHRKFQKYVKSSVSSQATGPCVIWRGTHEVPFDPVTERNMEIDVPYSENKQRRWELRDQLQACLKTETGSDKRIVYGQDPLFRGKTTFCVVKDSDEPCKASDKGENISSFLQQSDDRMNVIKRVGVNRERIRNKPSNHRDHHRPRSSKEIPMRAEEDPATVAGPKMSYVAFEPPMYLPKSENRRSVCCWDRSGVVQLRRKHKRQMKDVKHEKRCSEFIDEVDDDVYSDEHDGSLNLGADSWKEQPTENNEAENVNLERTSSISSVTDSDSWVFVEFPCSAETGFPDTISSSHGD
ncbi:uncharacterized protein DEA37_0004465 [Paragonimus westermani]|uniref:Uncharacterized protein n=1 Tax=Paragonimus westermani TaxID=34504 RepID=A0A5J4NQ65_9TREM|nr:uncharacterized protein DEA37_0004465 [Paragonimus westermani]